MTQDLTISFTVDQSPAEVFGAINNVRGWWSGIVEGDTNKIGAQFTYRVPDVHYCAMKITEYIPGRRVVWHVTDSYLNYLDDKTEWNNTTITFDIGSKEGATEVTFTHKGLVPAIECYNECSVAWGMLINRNLRNLITTGVDQPNVFAPKE